jgi:hypothetical protein
MINYLISVIPEVNFLNHVHLSEFPYHRYRCHLLTLLRQTYRHRGEIQNKLASKYCTLFCIAFTNGFDNPIRQQLIWWLRRRLKWWQSLCVSLDVYDLWMLNIVIFWMLWLVYEFDMWMSMLCMDELWICGCECYLWILCIVNVYGYCIVNVLNFQLWSWCILFSVKKIQILG